MTTAVLGQDTRRVGRGRPGVRSTLTPGAALGLGVAMVWFSLLVLIPLAAVVVVAGGNGLSGYVDALKNPQSWAAIKLTVSQSILVTLLNVVMGTLIAWVLVRDRFWGKRMLDIVIDVPFAMPTIVAGLVLLSLYGPESPLGVNVANTRMSVTRGPGVRHPAVHRPHRAARARRARGRRRGGRRLARRRADDDPATDRAALAGPGDRGGRRAVVRPGDLGVRLAGADQRPAAVQDRGGLGARPRPSSRAATGRRPRLWPRSCSASRSS